ncbi:MAG: hypothetical protein DRJ05_05010 [Bacteroidetes bacterium]|nr:MAG: hypothetical protein DRJ05_05010 [Bacteroidota bacterium]
MGLNFQSSAQYGNYNINSQTVLATSNAYNYTEGHFNKALRFLEFILGTQISESEKQQGLKESIAEFNMAPLQSIQQVEQVDLQMQQLYQLTDPVQIALARSMMLYQLFAASSNMQEIPFMIQLMNKYTPMLAYDSDNMLVFTEPDFQGYLKMAQLNAQATGQNLQYSEEEVQQLRAYLSEQFNFISLEQKQSMCTMAVMAEYSTASYNQMPAEQQTAWQNQMLNQQAYQYQSNQSNSMEDAFQQGYNLQQEQNANYEVEWPAGVNTKAEKQAHLQQMRSNMNSNAASFGIMNDVMMNNHATMMNSIENYGGTGNYWEVKYDDY